MPRRSRFHPLQLKPELFFDARDLVGLVADGGAIATWPNLGTLGGSAVQAVGAQQPTFSMRGYNGQPTVGGDDIDDHLLCTQVISQSPTLDPSLVIIGDPSSMLSGMMGVSHATSSLAIKMDGTAYYGATIKAGIGLFTSGISIVQGGHGRVLDGGTEKSNVKGTMGNNNTNQFMIGHAAFPLRGEIFAAIYHSASFSAPELNAIIEWANDIWGLNVPATVQPWTPSLLDPEAEWDVMRSLHEDPAGFIPPIEDGLPGWTEYGPTEVDISYDADNDALKCLIVGATASGAGAHYTHSYYGHGKSYTLSFEYRTWGATIHGYMRLGGITFGAFATLNSEGSWSEYSTTGCSPLSGAPAFSIFFRTKGNEPIGTYWEVRNVKVREHYPVGAKINRLPDRTGNGYDGEQTTPAKQPVIALHNGRKGLRFDGTDDFFDLAIALTLGVDDWTFVVLLADVQDSLDRQEILCKDSNEQFRLNAVKTPNPYFKDDSGNDRINIGSVIGTGDDSIIILTIDYSAENVLFQNGVNEGAVVDVYTDNLDGFEYIGSMLGTSKFLESTLCYLAVIKRVLVDGERKRVERFLALRGNITL